MGNTLRIWGHASRPMVMCWCLFAFAFVFRAAVGLAVDSPHQFVRYEPSRIAISLAQNGTYANPFPAPTGPTAHIAPLYPLLLCLIFKIFGTALAGEVVKQILTSAVAALRAPLIALLALRLGLGSRTALIGSLLSAVWIGALETEIRGEFDSSWEALLIMALLWIAYNKPLSGNWRPGSSLLYGVLWGITVLFNPVVLLILGVLAVIGLFETSRRKLVYSAQIALIGAGIILTLLPWAIRNRLTLGTWIWTRSNLGLELWCSYHPGANWNLLGNFDPRTAVHPSRNLGEAAEAKQLGEVAYNAKKMQQALAFIRSHPGESARLLCLRTYHFWFPWRQNKIHEIVSGLFTMLAGIGAVLLYKENKLFGRMAWIVLLVFPLTYYVNQWSSRYRLPMEWLLVLMVSLALARLADRVLPSLPAALTESAIS